MDQGDHYRTFGGWWLVWESYSETRHSMRAPGYPIVDGRFYAERTADELKRWRNNIASQSYYFGKQPREV